MSDSVVVVGLGLIGGSLGRALLEKGWEVSFLDPNVSLDEAMRNGAATRKLESWGEVSAAPGIVVLATPVDVAIRQVAELGPEVSCTSVCSLLAPMRDAARGSGSLLVAGHPMAGSAESGLGASRSDLFAGHTWFLDQDASDSRVVRMISSVGARLIAVDCEEHDRAVARTSHLPQLLSTALAAMLADSPGLEPFHGSGLRTFLRLAASEGSVWQPIFEANRSNVIEALEQMLVIARGTAEGTDTSVFDRAHSLMKRSG